MMLLRLLIALIFVISTSTNAMDPLDDLSGKLTLLSKSLENLKTNLGSLSTHLGTLKTKLDKVANGEVETEEDAKKEEEERLEIIKQTEELLKDIEKEYSSIEKKIKDYEEKLNDLTVESKAKEDAKTELSKIKQKFEKLTIDALKKMDTSTKSAADNYKKKLENSNKTIENVKALITLFDEQDMITEASGKQREYTEIIRKTEKINKELESKIKNLEKDVNVYKNALIEMADSDKDSTEKFDELQSLFSLIKNISYEAPVEQTLEKAAAYEKNTEALAENIEALSQKITAFMPVFEEARKKSHKLTFQNLIRTLNESLNQITKKPVKEIPVATEIETFCIETLTTLLEGKEVNLSGKSLSFLKAAQQNLNNSDNYQDFLNYLNNDNEFDQKDENDIKSAITSLNFLIKNRENNELDYEKNNILYRLSFLALTCLQEPSIAASITPELFARCFITHSKQAHIALDTWKMFCEILDKSKERLTLLKALFLSNILANEKKDDLNKELNDIFSSGSTTLDFHQSFASTLSAIKGNIAEPITDTDLVSFWVHIIRTTCRAASDTLTKEPGLKDGQPILKIVGAKSFEKFLESKDMKFSDFAATIFILALPAQQQKSLWLNIFHKGKIHITNSIITPIFDLIELKSSPEYKNKFLALARTLRPSITFSDEEVESLKNLIKESFDKAQDLKKPPSQKPAKKLILPKLTKEEQELRAQIYKATQNILNLLTFYESESLPPTFQDFKKDNEEPLKALERVLQESTQNFENLFLQNKLIKSRIITLETILNFYKPDFISLIGEEKLSKHIDSLTKTKKQPHTLTEQSSSNVGIPIEPSTGIALQTFLNNYDPDMKEKKIKNFITINKTILSTIITLSETNWLQFKVSPEKLESLERNICTIEAFKEIDNALTAASEDFIKDKVNKAKKSLSSARNAIIKRQQEETKKPEPVVLTNVTIKPASEEEINTASKELEKPDPDLDILISAEIGQTDAITIAIEKVSDENKLDTLIAKVEEKLQPSAKISQENKSRYSQMKYDLHEKKLTLFIKEANIKSNLDQFELRLLAFVEKNEKLREKFNDLMTPLLETISSKKYADFTNNFYALSSLEFQKIIDSHQALIKERENEEKQKEKERKEQEAKEKKEKERQKNAAELITKLDGDFKAINAVNTYFNNNCEGMAKTDPEVITIFGNKLQLSPEKIKTLLGLFTVYSTFITSKKEAHITKIPFLLKTGLFSILYHYYTLDTELKKLPHEASADQAVTFINSLLAMLGNPDNQIQKICREKLNENHKTLIDRLLILYLSKSPSQGNLEKLYKLYPDLEKQISVNLDIHIADLKTKFTKLAQEVEKIIDINKKKTLKDQILLWQSGLNDDTSPLSNKEKQDLINSMDEQVKNIEQSITESLIAS